MVICDIENYIAWLWFILEYPLSFEAIWTQSDYALLIGEVFPTRSYLYF